MTSHFNKIQWTEGMLLKPQHFQQQDRHFEYLIQTQLISFNRFFWGFSELEIDKDLLKSGYLSVTKAKGYFPDGTYFDIPTLSKVPEALKVEQSLNSTRIYLSLTRYEISTINVNNTESEIIEPSNLGVKTPNLKLLGKDQISDEMNYLTVAELVRENTNQEIKCNEDHIPPIININSCNKLILNLKIISHKIQEIIENDRSIPKSAEYNCYIKFQYMNILKKAFYTLQHLLSAAQTHPESIYLSLLELASGLSSIHQTELSKNLYHYEHEDLSHSFNHIINFIKSALELNPYQDSHEIILKENHYGFWMSSILDKRFLNKTLVLCIKIEENKSLANESIPKHLKIGTPNTIYTLVKQALPGITLTHLKSTPNSIPISNNEISFVLEKNSKCWAELTQELSIALHGTLSLGKFQPRLWVLE